MRNTAPVAYTAVPTGVTVCSGHVGRNLRSRSRNPAGHLRRTIGHVPGITGHVGPEYSLLESNGGRQAFNAVHFRYASLVDQASCIGRYRFEVAALRLGVKRAKGK